MAFGGDLVAKLGLDARAFTTGLTRAQNKLAAVGNGTIAQRGLRQGNEALNRIQGGMFRTMVAANLATSAITSFFQKLGEGVKLAAATEQLKLSFEVLAGSAEIGVALFNEMEKLAQSTSLTLAETTQAAKQLLISFDATQIPDLVRTLGNISSSFDNVTLQEMAWLLQTSRTEGKLLARDIRQFTTRGIPLVDALRDVMNIRGSDYGEQIMSLASEGQVRIEHLMAALEKIGDNDMLARQGQTAMGKWNQATDSIRFFLRDLGDVVISTFGVKEGLDVVKQSMTSAREGLRQWLPVLGSIGGAVQSFFGMLRDIGGLIASVGSTLVSSLGGSIEDVSETFVGLMAGVSFGLDHWRDLWAVVGLTGRLWMARVYDSVNHFFSAQLPAYFNWFLENWQNVFRTAADFLRTVLENMGHNVGEFFNQVYQNAITMGAHGWDPMFRGLVDGFQNTIAALPDIPEPLSSRQQQIEEQLDRIKERFGAGLSQEMEDAILKLREFVTPDAPGLGPKKPFEFPTGSSQGDKPPASLLQGTREAYSAIVRAMRKDPVVSAVKDQTSKQAQWAAAIQNAMKKSRPRVVQGFQP